jgi:hypothetical protein
MMYVCLMSTAGAKEHTDGGACCARGYALEQISQPWMLTSSSIRFSLWFAPKPRQGPLLVSLWNECSVVLSHSN